MVQQKEMEMENKKVEQMVEAMEIQKDSMKGNYLGKPKE